MKTDDARNLLYKMTLCYHLHSRDAVICKIRIKKRTKQLAMHMMMLKVSSYCATFELT